MTTDVVVVGAGLAGMRAALSAAEAGARVALVDRGSIGTGSNSAMSNAAFAGPISPERADEYVELVLEIGKRLNRPSYVRRVAVEAPGAVAFLESLGLELARRPGQWMVRSPRPAVIPGIPLVRAVALRVGQEKGIRVERGLAVQSLVTRAGRAVGVRSLDRDGEERTLSAGAVILACGGAGAIFRKHDNQATILGQGYALAAQAGLPLWDMEFVQCYPIVLDEPEMPMMMIYPPYPAEARLLGPSGTDLIDKYGLGNINQAIVRRRDSFAALLQEEGTSGPVRMDLRAVPEAAWEAHPLSLLRRFRAVCAERPIRVSPAVHFCMGGVWTGERGETTLPGLFACGELVWGLHGANRMGGNALMECLVSGKIAGEGAAGDADRVPAGRDDPAEIGGRPCPDTVPADLAILRERIRTAAWRDAGILRSGEGMARGLAEAEAIALALRTVRTETPRERLLRSDLVAATFSLRAILTAGLGREESRGCFLRSDHPVQDDGQWRRNSRLSWDPAADRFRVDYVLAEATGTGGES
jgi:succinate dehydrogenase/fumarate reductase flavoprotein subunit